MENIQPWENIIREQSFITSRGWGGGGLALADPGVGLGQSGSPPSPIPYFSASFVLSKM